MAVVATTGVMTRSPETPLGPDPLLEIVGPAAVVVRGDRRTAQTTDVTTRNHHRPVKETSVLVHSGRQTAIQGALRETTGRFGRGDRAEVSRERSVQDEDLNRREEAALDQYLQENPSYNQSDIADVETTEGGEFSIEFTSSGQREYVDQNLQGTEQMGSAPEGAEQLMSRSGEDATVVYDQGAEVGDGPIAEQAADVEEEVLEDNPSLDANDVRVNVSATGEFSVELTEEGRNEVREAANDPNRANQSVSLGTTGTGTDRDAAVAKPG